MDITVLLKEKGLTKSQLADRLGIYNQNVNKLLTNPTEANIKRIADALEVPVWQLFASREEIIGEPDNRTSGHCPHCGKPITIRTSIE